MLHLTAILVIFCLYITVLGIGLYLTRLGVFIYLYWIGERKSIFKE